MTSFPSASSAGSSSASSAALPPAPVVRMRDPAELLAAVPFLIGFHPRDSLVVLVFEGPSGRRVGLTQRVDLPPPEHAAAVGRALAANAARGTPTGAAVLVVGGGPVKGEAGEGGVEEGTGPPRRALVDTVTAALHERGVPARLRAWAAGTGAGAAWACYDECGCRGVLPDPAATPLAATAVAAGIAVHADRAALERLVAPAAGAVLRRRERLLTRAVDTQPPPGPADREAATTVVDAALGDTVEGRLHLDDGRVLALAMALADPLVRDAALVRCAGDAESAEQLWAALARETPDPEAAEPAALLAACALLRGDGALAGIALDRAEQAWPGHRLTALLRAAWQAGMRPAQVRECLLSTPLPPAARARVRRGRGRRR
jgi:uncharacterized protein DUF4192